MESLEDSFLSPELKKKYVTSHILGSGACGIVRLVYKAVSNAYLKFKT